MEEADRLRLRYSGEGDLGAAISSAIEDLTSAGDYSSKPFDDRPTKMEAMDFLRLVAMVLPERITDDIVSTMKTQFANCNDSSQLEVMMVLALAGRRESLSFIRDTIETIPDPKDWTRQAAEEAVDVLEGRREIGERNMQGRWIYRIIKAQEVSPPALNEDVKAP